MKKLIPFLVLLLCVGASQPPATEITIKTKFMLDSYAHEQVLIFGFQQFPGPNPEAIAYFRGRADVWAELLYQVNVAVPPFNENQLP